MAQPAPVRVGAVDRGALSRGRPGASVAATRTSGLDSHPPGQPAIVDLVPREQPQNAAIDGSEPETLSVRPLRVFGCHFDRYTSAIRHLDPPRLFESRPSYRLLAASFREQRLHFGMGAYFDKLDFSEALGHEVAAAFMPGGLPDSPGTLRGKLPFRELIGDPFDLRCRAVIPAITTLTIRLRRYPAEPSCLLHWRDPAKVATAAGVYDVVPAGEFQPSSVALWDRRNDFDLWRNIVREYAEELLGEPEYDGTRSAPIAYDRWESHHGPARPRASGGGLTLAGLPRPAPREHLPRPFGRADPVREMAHRKRRRQPRGPAQGRLRRLPGPSPLPARRTRRRRRRARLGHPAARRADRVRPAQLPGGVHRRPASRRTCGRGVGPHRRRSPRTPGPGRTRRRRPPTACFSRCSPRRCTW
jgi:hypothetical protein